MGILKRKLVRFLGWILRSVPEWSKPVLRPFESAYFKIYDGVSSSISEEELIRTPYGPLIYVNYWDHVEREIANGIYERKYINLFCSKIQEGNVVVDIGAYIGIFSLLASEIVGDKGRVYAFEPVPRNYERLMRNIEVNKAKNIKAYNLGLSDKEEITYIYIPKEIPAEATLHQRNINEILKGIKMEKDIAEVQLKPFAQFCDEEGLNKVDVMKIDVEGSELKVLKGMGNMLKFNGRALFIEISPQLIEAMDGTLEELIGLLINFGFKRAYSVKLGLEKNLAEAQFMKGGGNFIVTK